MVNTWSITDALSRPRPTDPLVVFFAVAFLASWPLWLFVVLGPDLSMGTAELLLAVALFGPAAGTLVALRFHGESLRAWVRRRALRPLPLRWLLVIPLVALAIELLQVGVVVPIPPLGANRVYLAEPAGWWDRAVGVVLSTSVLAGVEEFGWRGYALPRLQARHGALAASVVLGLLWGLWHLPAHVAGGVVSVEFAKFIARTVALSIVFTWLFNATDGNVWSAVLFHAAHNVAITVVGPVGMTDFLLGHLVVVLAPALVAAYPIYRYGPATLSPRGIAGPIGES